MILLIPLLIPLKRVQWDQVFASGRKGLGLVIPLILLSRSKRMTERTSRAAGEKSGRIQWDQWDHAFNPAEADRKSPRGQHQSVGSPVGSQWDHNRGRQ